MDEAWKASVESRLGELKGAIEGLRYGVSMLGGSVALPAVVTLGGFAFLDTQMVRIDGRIDRLAEKVDALPDKINANLRDLTSTLANSITAARSGPPQVILLPAPQLPAPPTPETPK